MKLYLVWEKIYGKNKVKNVFWQMNFCFGKMIGVGNSKRLLAPVNKYLDISSKYKQPTL
ncbi:MAG: hypothetical protein RIR11_2957 [Bacteroidota bacterium]|jgi:hypothetical protein